MPGRWREICIFKSRLLPENFWVISGGITENGIEYNYNDVTIEGSIEDNFQNIRLREDRGLTPCQDNENTHEYPS